MPPLRNDTSNEASAVQLQILRKMGPARRSLLSAQWSEELRKTAMEGIRNRHKQFDDRRILLEYARMTLGEELFQAAFGSEIVEAE